jgi:hypothetical protein
MRTRTRAAPAGYRFAGSQSSTRLPDGSWQDLLAAGSFDDFVAEPGPCVSQAGDFAVEVIDDEVDAVPATR